MRAVLEMEEPAASAIKSGNREVTVGAALRGRPSLGRSRITRSNCPACFRNLRRAPLLAVFGVLAGYATVSAQTGAGASTVPDANPGRPTVSTPATLTPVGYLQFETGALAAAQSPEFSSRYSVAEVIKFSINSRVEFLASEEPFVHFTARGNPRSLPAELFLGAQAVISPGDGAKPTVAAGYVRRVYDGGAAELDLGSPVNSFLVLASADVKGFHYDANAVLNELRQGLVRRPQFGQTLSISHALGRFTLSGEIWHFSQPFLSGNAVGNLWAVSYAVRKNLVIDGGFNRGLTATSTRWEAFVGFTYLLPHRIGGPGN